ncbi:MAG TPA: hypothetical protein VFW44_11115 [Bryobacteraceae bacterium]|nr:hypothetical protein [Bryobacteraceae bacterium]
MTGYTQTELEDVQAKWGFRFPPDLLERLREERTIIPGDDFDWITTPDEKIKDVLGWPLEGFLFDVQHGLWWPDWGDRPVDEASVEGRFREIFSAAPKLLPVYGHRYIPEEPHEGGNPIFSVWQMDVIYYGADLSDYVDREMRATEFDAGWPRLKQIRFWSRAVEYNAERFENGGGFAFYNKNNVLPEV